MNYAVSFQTRARTIDHLGREQIADVPTAISELWKNAYDAYATSVALHIYDMNEPIVSVLDNGHGMSRAQFMDKWLVVGTESKVSKSSVLETHRNGLAERPKQGQKGIGRLSVAALGAVALIISKQVDSPFTASLIDWRLFENPYLFLHDIRVPVVEFTSTADLINLIPTMRTEVIENLTGNDGDIDRKSRLLSAWSAFNELENENNPDSESTFSRISRSITAEIPYDLILKDWSVWTGEKDSGTAIVIAEISRSLAAWTLRGEAAKSDEVEAVKASLLRTLTGFSDPYEENIDSSMDYKVVAHVGDEARVILERDDGYGIKFLRSLDHCLEGEFDDHGIFRGQVRAFGKDIGPIEILPAQHPPTKPRERVGPFAIRIGAFEVVARSSVLPPEVHQKVTERAQTHSGLSIYRDGLRVMPYGRPETDFFKIEERRQFHAGREFWANRRLFGAIAISRENNPNLRDKAGREGFIDNIASRSMQILVIDLLKTTARRYFGSDSPIRADLLPAIEAENDAAAKQAKLAKKSQLNTFRKAIRDQEQSLISTISKIGEIETTLNSAISINDINLVWSLASTLDEISTICAELRLPPKPKNLGSYEERYRNYRDTYAEICTRVNSLRTTWNSETERLRAKPPIDILRSQLGRNQKAISNRLIKWQSSIESLLKSEINRISTQVAEDHKEYYKLVSPLLSDLESNKTSLSTALNELDEARDRLINTYTDRYEPYLRAHQLLASGLDLDGAFAYAGARESTLERRLEQIQGLAQIGISVEILSHELQSIDFRLTKSLNSLPEIARNSSEFEKVLQSRDELVDRLRFLSQMQVSGNDIQKPISGQDIDEYLRLFFGTRLGDQGVLLESTREFLESAFYEYPSRIFPVFINLINNSLYWISEQTDARIIIHKHNNSILIGDNGPGIDKEDIPSLFDLFFTRRIRGRGVGLYLCRQTLASGGHTINYVTNDSEKVLPGANFVINLRSGFDAKSD